MIRLQKIRELTLTKASHPSRHRHLSAASGLVKAGGYLYVVADDELHLGIFSATDDAPGELFPLIPGKLPLANDERKASKPDFEALTLLPAFPGYPDGALLALSSGSKPNRHLGVLVALDAHGAVNGVPRVVDLSSLYRSLKREIHKLNIEGAIVAGNELCLLQRGNKRNAHNACIRLRLPEVLPMLRAPVAADVDVTMGIQTFDLGTVHGIPLSFSDGAALANDDFVFTAIAEDTGDSYDDGPCAGAAIGIASSNGDLRYLEMLERPEKIEGVDAHLDGTMIRLLLVTDADDESIPASLYSAEIHD